MRKIFEGLKILLKYDPDGDADAQHDELFASDVPPDKMEPDDVKQLTDLGWRWDTRLTSWRKFT
jgi:hypothetical protein